MSNQRNSDKPTKNKGRDYVSCESCQMDRLCRPIMVGDTDINAIREILQRRIPIERGQIIYRKGDPFKSIFAVCAGSFKISSESSDHHERVLGFHLAGELMGTYAIYGQQYPYTAQALEPSSICEIPYDALERFGKHIPDIMSAITMLMSEEIQYTQSLLSLHTGKINAEERLASFLVGISTRFQKHGFPDREFKLSMSRSDIGSYLGLTKETISRLLSQFQDKGLLTASGKHISLLDMDGLQSLAGT